MLISRSGEVVPKNEIIDAVWAETAVEENNLTQQIAAAGLCASGPLTTATSLRSRKGVQRSLPVNELEIADEEIVVTHATRSTVTIDVSTSGGSVRAFFARSTVFGCRYLLTFSSYACSRSGRCWWELPTPNRRGS